MFIWSSCLLSNLEYICLVLIIADGLHKKKHDLLTSLNIHKNKAHKSLFLLDPYKMRKTKGNTLGFTENWNKCKKRNMSEECQIKCQWHFCSASRDHSKQSRKEEHYSLFFNCLHFCLITAYCSNGLILTARFKSICIWPYISFL